MDVWKNLKEFPGYQINNFGIIKSNKYHKQMIIKLDKNNKGYYRVRLSNNGKVIKRYIHILVYETFYDDKTKKNECVHHKDENKENNYYKNLEKMTKYKHKSLHGKTQIGIKNPHHKLVDQDVIQIKLLLNKGILTQQKIANMFGVTRQLISKIKTGKIWLYKDSMNEYFDNFTE
ncbi:MAG: NUMOD4 domain-containing protein [Patescibacteria group bacterium]